MMVSRVSFKIFTLFSVIAMFLGCSDKLLESSEWTSVALKDVPESLIVGDTLQLLMRVKYGPERERLYDFSKNDLGVKVEVNSQVAEYLGNGTVKLISPGVLELSITSDKNEAVSEKVSIKVLERNYKNVIGQPLHSKLLCSSLILKYNVSMQTFGVSGNGDYYMCSLYGEKLSVQKVNDKGIAEGDPMIISDADDGMCFSVEGVGTDVYMWMCTNDGIVVRERFIAGQSLSLKTCSDCYYLGNQSYVRLSVDNFKKRIAFFSSEDNAIRTFSLDAVKASSKKDVNIAGRVVRTADVTQCETIESLKISIAQTEVFSTYDSKYYISGGDMNESAVTACDKDGNYYFIKLPYGVDDNTVKTIKYGLSDTGELEPAGIVYANGSLYQGYRSTVAGENKNTIIKFGEVPLKGLIVNGFDGGHESFTPPQEEI